MYQGTYTRVKRVYGPWVRTATKPLKEHTLRSRVLHKMRSARVNSAFHGVRFQL